MAKAIEANDTLKLLHLSNNDVGPAGDMAMTKALQTNKTIMDARFDDNIADDFV